jgi:hypothetical protein
VFALAVAPAVLVGLTCGCGAAGSPTVASLGTARSTTVADGAPGSTHPSMLAFSRCMRAHGVADFPDPSPQGWVKVTQAIADSPRFRPAQKACGALLPPTTPGEAQRADASALAFSVCMRAHGLPDFPDPTVTKNGVFFHYNPQGGGNRPRFHRAQQACSKDVPGGGP